MGITTDWFSVVRGRRGTAGKEGGREDWRKGAKEGGKQAGTGIAGERGEGREDG